MFFGINLHCHTERYYPSFEYKCGQTGCEVLALFTFTLQKEAVSSSKLSDAFSKIMWC
jgi:hypothetical protein